MKSQMAWQRKLQRITEWPGFSREYYRESQNGLAKKNYRELQRIAEWPGFSSKNYRESQIALDLAVNISENYRMAWQGKLCTENYRMAWQGKLQRITEWPGFNSEYYRESQNGLARKITENHRMACL